MLIAPPLCFSIVTLTFTAEFGFFLRCRRCAIFWPKFFFGYRTPMPSVSLQQIMDIITFDLRVRLSVFGETDSFVVFMPVPYWTYDVHTKSCVSVYNTDQFNCFDCHKW